MRLRTLHAVQILPKPIEEVFAFFSDAYNLNNITPPWLHFNIVTPRPISMGCGALIDYRLRWRGLPIRWRTLIDEWEPPIRFIDRQIRGPYRQWVHEHTFESVPGGTLMRDRIDYAARGWILEPICHRLLVGPDVEKIFAYRRQRLTELFGALPG